MCEQDYHISSEEKADEIATFKLNFGRCPPSYLLKWAENYEFIPEALEVEQGYLVPYYNLLTEIKRLIRIDDKDQFASFLVANHELVHEYSPDGLLHLLCTHSAVSCATALLESRLDVDVNSTDEKKLVYHIGLPPLHIAAENLSSGMTKLLLEHGADAERDIASFQTPLHTALAAFMKHKYISGWTADKSILTLLYSFCLPELKEPLDTLRLLASHSNKVEDLCIRYMNVGYVEAYAALLMVAWDKLMVSSAKGGLETTPVGQHLSRVLSNASLQQEICERKFKVLSEERLVKNLMTALSVVNTMWMTIGVLERYCHLRVKSVPVYELPFHIACELVKDAGLYSKPSGANIECFQPNQPNLTSEAKVLLEQKYYAEPRRSGPILRSLLGKPVTAVSPSLSTVPHFQYRTLHVLNFMENHLCKTPLVKPSSHNVLALAKVCAPLVWMAKRIIK